MFSVETEPGHHWERTSLERHGPRTVLWGDRAADLVVVGGGLTGLSAGLSAARSGLKVIVLEAGGVGSAASGRNNGLVIPHHSKASPQEIISSLGKRSGERFNEFVGGASQFAFTLIRENGIACDAVQQGWIQPSHSATALVRARQMHDQWKALGANVAWLSGDEVTQRVGTRYDGGWMLAEGGHVNPYALAQGLARATSAAGAELFEGAPVQTIDRIGTTWRLRTAQGSVISPQVLLATNALTQSLLPDLNKIVIPVKLFQAVTAPIPEVLRRSVLNGNPAVSDTRRDIRAFHYDRDFRIVSGGTLTFWHDARRRGTEATRRMLLAAFPCLGPELVVEGYWEGVLGVVPDRKPRLMRLAPGLVFAGIYSGRGVALSIALGTAVGKWLRGDLSDDDMPLPVTNVRHVPMHSVAVQVAHRIHPLHRLQDRFS